MKSAAKPAAAMWAMPASSDPHGSGAPDTRRRQVQNAIRALSLTRTVRFDHSLEAYTTYRIGGPAWAVAEPVNARELQRLLSVARETATPTLVLGAGSNVLVRDGGFPGLAIRLAGAFDTIADVTMHKGGPGRGLLMIGAAVPIARVVRKAVERGYLSLLRLVGIPGTMGGVVAMNAGTGATSAARGAVVDGYVGDLVVSVGVVDADGAWDVPHAECGFRYRGTALPPLSVVADAFVDVGAERATAEEAQELVREKLARRRATQPVTLPNAGSVFKNPPGDHAARLVEAAGLKGARIGGAEVSAMHGNFIVNYAREARASDVLALIELCRRSVRQQFGIDLETEVRIVGVDDDY